MPGISAAAFINFINFAGVHITALKADDMLDTIFLVTLYPREPTTATPAPFRAFSIALPLQNFVNSCLKSPKTPSHSEGSKILENHDLVLPSSGFVDGTTCARGIAVGVGTGVGIGPPP